MKNQFNNLENQIASMDKGEAFIKEHHNLIEERNNLLKEREKLSIDYEELLRRKESETELLDCLTHDLKNSVTVLEMGEEVVFPLIDKVEFSTDEKGRIESCYLLRRYVRSLINSGRKIKNLSDILKLTQISQEELEASSSHFSPLEIMDETIKSYEHHLIMKNNSGVRLYFPEGFEQAKINSNLPAFSSVISNLFSNAINYAFIPSVIQSRISHQEGNLILELENMVSKPIDSDEIKFLFEKGYKKESRGDAMRKNEGLGLYFVQKVIKTGFGGEVDILSDNKFQITLDKVNGFNKREYGFIPRQSFSGNLPSFYIRCSFPAKYDSC
jgi:signal transduction histidine kinase